MTACVAMFHSLLSRNSTNGNACYGDCHANECIMFTVLTVMAVETLIFYLFIYFNFFFFFFIIIIIFFYFFFRIAP